MSAGHSRSCSCAPPPAWAECHTPRAPSGAAQRGLGRRPVRRADQPCADPESVSQLRDALSASEFRDAHRCAAPLGSRATPLRQVGQPLHLTARQLLHDQQPDSCSRANPRPALRGALVYVRENPTVVAEAANRLSPKCAPLKCAPEVRAPLVRVSGHPAAAATVLLRQLASAGAALRYHGDFDWPGIIIANAVMSRFGARFGARPWRFDAPSYREAAARDGPRLRGKPVPATWDPDLKTSMQHVAIKVEEERVLATMPADLAH